MQPMSFAAENDDITLALLLCSKLCHDLVSPIGAVNNGLEILQDDADAATEAEAMKLISASASLASAKLRMMRIAYGGAGFMAENVSLEEPRELCDTLARSSRIRFEWIAADQLSLDKDIVRLLMNFILIGVETLPRGGVLRIGVRKEGATNLMISAEGDKARMHEKAPAVLTDGADLAELEPRLANYYLTHRIAKSLGASIFCDAQPDRVELAATM